MVRMRNAHSQAGKKLRFRYSRGQHEWLVSDKKLERYQKKNGVQPSVPGGQLLKPFALMITNQN